MGASDKSAQKNNQTKGNKKDLKKPLQVLHISKKDTNNKEETLDGNQSLSKDKYTEEKGFWRVKDEGIYLMNAFKCKREKPIY